MCSGSDFLLLFTVKRKKKSLLLILDGGTEHNTGYRVALTHTKPWETSSPVCLSNFTQALGHIRKSVAYAVVPSGKEMLVSSCSYTQSLWEISLERPLSQEIIFPPHMGTTPFPTSPTSPTAPHLFLLTWVIEKMCRTWRWCAAAAAGIRAVSATAE